MPSERPALLPAPQDDNKPGKKDTGTATLISVLITGGGQIYTGETNRGLLLLGGGLGSVVVGCTKVLGV